MRQITACPDCNSSFIRRATRHSDWNWRCEECGNRFDEPIQREPIKHSGRSNSGTTAALLEELDADAIGGETSV